MKYDVEIKNIFKLKHGSTPIFIPLDMKKAIDGVTQGYDLLSCFSSR